MPSYQEKNIHEISTVTPLPEGAPSLSADGAAGTAGIAEQPSLVDLFQTRAEKTPHAVALEFKERHLTYGELGERVRRLAARLADKGVGEGTIVGILVERSIEAVIAILAVLRAGGAYLAVDPSYSRERVRYMLRDGNVNLLIRGEGEKTEPSPALEAVEVIHLHPAGRPEKTSTAQLPPVPSSSAAYITYTSGSTGRPKGIVTRHGAVAAYLGEQAAYLGINAAERILQAASLTFDASVEQIWLALSTGAVLVLTDRETLLDNPVFESFIMERSVTHLHSVPPFLNTLSLETGDLVFPLRRVIAAGDTCPVALARKWAGRCAFYNKFGSTESTISSVQYRVEELPEDALFVPIGRPMGGTRVYVLDEEGNPCPPGTPGELYVGGPGVSPGYLNEPALTAERFVWLEGRGEKGEGSKNISDAPAPPRAEGRSFLPSPLSPLPTRFYRTGDRVCLLPDGNLRFMGRLDRQVKIRGFRVEPGEIQHWLTAYGPVKEAVVMLRRDAGDEPYLCAYFTALEPLGALRLRHYLAGKLPGFMIPPYFVQMQTIPLTENKKVAFEKLPTPPIGSSSKYEPPREEAEFELLKIWAELLHAGKEDFIGVNDNFFELGGQSLKATLLTAKIHKAFDVRLPLAEILKTPTIRGLARQIKRASLDVFVPLEAVEKKEYYPLSTAQKRMYVLQQMEQEGTGYNMPHVYSLHGEVDIQRLEQVFHQIIRRHESLRTTIEIRDGAPVQVIHDEIDFCLRGAGPPAGGACRGVESIVGAFIQPFELSQPPLFRAGFWTPDGGPVLLILDLHHIISDGLSMEILTGELESLYTGLSLSPLKLHYRDYAHWENRTGATARMKEQEAYWVKTLSEEIPPLQLPTDYPRPPVWLFDGDTFSFDIGSREAGALYRWAVEEQTTLFMVLLAVFYIFLAKLSNQQDFIIGTPVAGRRHADLEHILGMFVNALPLRNRVSGTLTFDRFLQQVNREALDAFDNQEYPFEEMVERVVKRRDTSRNPLFDASFTLQVEEISGGLDTEQVEPDQTAGLVIRPYDYKAKIAKFDLILRINEKNGLQCSFEYSSKLFKRETMRRFSAYFSNAVAGIIDGGDKFLYEIDVLPEVEKELILNRFNDTGVSFPDRVSILQLAEEQAARHPDAVALVDGDRRVTYGRLNLQAHRLALELREKGIVYRDIVGMLTERSIEMMAGVLGILKAGAAYLPMAPDTPAARVRYMLLDSRAAAVVYTRPLEVDLPEGIERIDLDGMATSDPVIEPGEPPLPKPGPRDLVYAIYTSGTTGTPKGVLVEHRGVVNYIVWRLEAYRYSSRDVNIMLSGYQFDSAAAGIYASLCGGGALVLPDTAQGLDTHVILHCILRYGVTTLTLAPGVYRVLLNEARRGDLDFVRFTTVAGEASGTAVITESREKAPKTLLINEYGPTEASICTTAYFGLDEQTLTLIGPPLANYSVFILDGYFKPVPLKVAGELYVGGIGVARGYLNRPELTVEKFVCPPSSAIRPLPSRLYNTGDLARWMPDGNIEYLGRIDHQVKIRGYRIEPGEVQDRIIEHPTVKDALVLTLTDDSGDNYLCAYMVPAEGVSLNAFDLPALKDALAENLPHYMIPSYFLPLAAFPLTAAGKIDRKALPRPQESVAAGHAPPTNRVESQLARIWAEVLKISSPGAISIDDNFFEIGGQSLKATLLTTNIRKTLQVPFPLAEVFKSNTIREQAQYIMKNSSQ